MGYRNITRSTPSNRRCPPSNYGHSSSLYQSSTWCSPKPRQSPHIPSINLHLPRTIRHKRIKIPLSPNRPPVEASNRGFITSTDRVKKQIKTAYLPTISKIVERAAKFTMFRVLRDTACTSKKRVSCNPAPNHRPHPTSHDTTGLWKMTLRFVLPDTNLRR